MKVVVAAVVVVAPMKLSYASSWHCSSSFWPPSASAWPASCLAQVRRFLQENPSLCRTSLQLASTEYWDQSTIKLLALSTLTLSSAVSEVD